MKAAFNITADNLAPCVTGDWGHVSSHHIIIKRMDRRYNMIGIIEVYEKTDISRP